MEDSLLKSVDRVRSDAEDLVQIIEFGLKPILNNIHESNEFETSVQELDKIFQEIMNIKDNFNPNINLVDSKQVKDEFNKYLDNVKKNYEEYLKNSYLQLKKEIDEAVRMGETKCSSEKNTTEKSNQEHLIYNNHRPVKTLLGLFG